MRKVLLGALLMMGFLSPTYANPPPQSISPLRVLILPADIKIYQLTAANNLDPQPLASASASTEALQDTQLFMQTSSSMVPVNMPTLDATEQAALNQHLALYRMAAAAALAAQRQGGVWQPAFEAFDYTVGPGLKFLQQKTGANVALVIIGKDVDSTGGHIAMSMFAALFGAMTTDGGNFMSAGFIDFDTGRIRWLDYDTSHISKNFTAPATINEYVREILQKYPQGSIHADNGI